MCVVVNKVAAAMATGRLVNQPLYSYLRVDLASCGDRRFGKLRAANGCVVLLSRRPQLFFIYILHPSSSSPTYTQGHCFARHYNLTLE